MPMRTSRLALYVWVLLVAGAQPVRTAQQTPCKTQSTYQDGAFGTKDCQGRFTPSYKPPFAPSSPPSSAVEKEDTEQQSSESQNRAVNSAAKAEEYSAWYDAYLRRIFNWQFYSTVVLFLVVVALVSFGLYFAYMQFKLSSHVVDATPQEPKISAHEVVLKSSFLGVVILAFSLAFFFLYLRYVYPITPTDLGRNIAATDKAKP